MDTASHSRSPPAAVDAAVRSIRLDMVFGSQPAALAVSVVLAGITAIVVRQVESGSRMVVWFAILLLVSVSRVWLYVRYRRARDRGISDLTPWERAFHYGCLLAGAAWGASALFFFPSDAVLQVFLAFVLAGVSAGATTELTVVPRTAHAFVIPCVLPLAARFFLEADPLHLAMGTMTFLYVGLIVTAGRRGQAQLNQMVSAQLDATASRRALTHTEASLQESEERLRLAIEAAEIGVWQWDLARDTLHWNDRMYRIHEVAPGSPVVYDLWFGMLHPEDRERVQSRLGVALESEARMEIEYRIVRPDGQERVLKLVGLVQRDGDGRASRVTGINLDVTELKRVERLKSEFVSIVSHELRTPLTSIRGALGMLTNESVRMISAEKSKELLALAARNAERLHGLIEDLLDFDEIESGRLPLDLKPQALAPLIDQSLSANGARAATQGISLHAVESFPALEAAVDAPRLLQVLFQLIDNAIKFSPAGGRVEIALVAHAGWARIEVRDQGPGIPLAFRARIFDRFCQGDASDMRAKGGTGLGLAISRTIVERMNGRIGFETELGRGTTFFVELPAVGDKNKEEMVERKGIEPSTFALRTRRSPS